MNPILATSQARRIIDGALTAAGLHPGRAFFDPAVRGLVALWLAGEMDRDTFLQRAGELLAAKPQLALVDRNDPRVRQIANAIATRKAARLGGGSGQDWLAILPEFLASALYDDAGAVAELLAAETAGASKLSGFDLAHVGPILQDRDGEFTNFSAHLLRLIKKVDADNRRALATIYPAHVAAVEAWERSA